MKPKIIIRQAAQLALLFSCTCCLTSCSTVGSILGYFLSLPGALLNAVIP